VTADDHFGKVGKNGCCCGGGNGAEVGALGEGMLMRTVGGGGVGVEMGV